MINPYQVFVLTLLMSTSLVNASTIYTWVDDKGVTHYNEQPPAQHVNAQQLNAAELEQKRIGFDSPKTTAKIDNSANKEKIKINAETIRLQNAEQADAICVQSKQNQLVLETYNRVTKTDPATNEKMVMNEEERAAALTESKKQVELFCKDRAAK